MPELATNNTSDRAVRAMYFTTLCVGRAGGHDGRFKWGCYCKPGHSANVTNPSLYLEGLRPSLGRESEYNT